MGSFESSISREVAGVRFHVDASEKAKIDKILSQVPKKPLIMVCPGSRWINKQLKTETFSDFLGKIEAAYGASFLFVWGDEAEKKQCLELASNVKRGVVSEKLPLPSWQNLMNEFDLVLAVDSSALHLCATTKTPSFSIFGPTSPNIFKPIGKKHTFYQGECPYGRVFDKHCPVLRSCPTGACIKDISSEALFQAFQNQRAFLQP